MPTRRDFIAGAGAGLALAGLAAPSVARAAIPFEQPPLTFAEDALQPVISARTVGLHYGKHHAAYYKALNELAAGTRYAEMNLEEIVVEAAKAPQDAKIFNNAAQAWNHVLYWDQFQPGGAKEPSGALAERIEADLGGLDKMKADIVALAGTVFGSGWVWLAQDGETIALAATQGGDNPLTKGRIPLLGIDVWEHAYYIDYENRRAEHVQAVLDGLVNWDYVAERMTE